MERKEAALSMEAPKKKRKQGRRKKKGKKERKTFGTSKVGSTHLY